MRGCIKITRINKGRMKKRQIAKEWEKGIVATIHKKGDNTDYENYGEVILLTSAYKRLSTLIDECLIKYVKAKSEVISAVL